MALLTLEAIGPDGEKLALKAGEHLGIPVGFDPEFECATFDADGLDEEALEAEVAKELSALDPGWQAHLRVAE